MHFLPQQSQELILTLLKKLFKKNLFIFINVFYPSDEPILIHLLRYREFAVDNHSYIPCASHLHQHRLVNNPAKKILISQRCIFYSC